LCFVIRTSPLSCFVIAPFVFRHHPFRVSSELAAVAMSAAAGVVAGELSVVTGTGPSGYLTKAPTEPPTTAPPPPKQPPHGNGNGGGGVGAPSRAPVLAGGSGGSGGRRSTGPVACVPYLLFGRIINEIPDRVR